MRQTRLKAKNLVREDKNRLATVTENAPCPSSTAAMFQKRSQHLHAQSTCILSSELAKSKLYWYFKGTDLFSMHLPKDKIEGLRQLDLVLHAHKNRPCFLLEDVSTNHDEDDGRHRHLTEFSSYHIDMVNARGVWNLPGGRGTRGARVKVCVVEDGLTSNNPDLDYSKIIAKPEMLRTGRDF